MKILIAEDDLTSRIMLQGLLKPYGGCDVAVNGVEAVTAFTTMLDLKMPYTLICLDIMMPEMNGQEALQKIRQIERERGIGGSDAVKVVMTTALDDGKNIMQALVRGGSDGYLTKPLDQKNMEKLLTSLGIHPLATGKTPPS